MTVRTRVVPQRDESVPDGRGRDGHMSDEGVLDGDEGVLDGQVSERAAVSQVRGLRVITLDSLVPGSVHGQVSTAQLDWLRSVLATPAPDGSVVVLHHPPISLSAPTMQAMVLQNPDELGQVIAGSDVRVVLCGHLHAQLSGFLYGVPVWSTTGIVTRLDLTAPGHLVRAVHGSGASVIDLGGPFSPLFHTLHARDPRAGELVYLADGSAWEEVEGEEPVV